MPDNFRKFLKKKEFTKSSRWFFEGKRKGRRSLVSTKLECVLGFFFRSKGPLFSPPAAACRFYFQISFRRGVVVDSVLAYILWI